MEPLDATVVKVKEFAKSGQDFINQLIHHHHTNMSRSNPGRCQGWYLDLCFPLQIEILKRLQRESFSDLMKLREKQDKFERILSLYKNVFEETSTTRVRGEIDVIGTALAICNLNEKNYDTLKIAGIRNNIDSWFIFETFIRKKDNLLVELMANHAVPENPLSLTKVCYTAHLTDWLLVSAIPKGAQCRDIGMTLNPHEGKSITDFSSLGPYLLTQHNGSGFGFTVANSNVVASLAQFVDSGSSSIRQSFSTFARVVCRLSRRTQLSLLGLHKVYKSSSPYFTLGTLAIPISTSVHRENSERTQPMESHVGTNDSQGSIALMLESMLEQSFRVGGWIELKNSNPACRQWAITVSDTPPNELGWGLRVSKMVRGNPQWDHLSTCLDHFQVEGFLKINVGENFSLQPGIAYVIDGARNIRVPALMLRSCWMLW